MEAASVFRQILASQPAHAPTLHMLGIICAQSSDLTEAERLIREAIRYSPREGSYHANLGNVLQESGRLEEAITSYQQGLTRGASSAEVQNNLGNALARLGRIEQAVAAYRNASGIRPDFPEAHFNLANALRNRGELDEALREYRRAIELRPDYDQAKTLLAGALLAAGNAFQLRGDYAQTIAAYRQAISIQPNYAEAHHNLGAALLETSELKDAIESFGRAIELSPQMGVAYQNLSNAMRDAGQVDEAIEAARQARSLMPDSPDALVALGNAFREAGCAPQALEAYGEALALAEKVPTVLKSRCLIASNLLFTLHFDPDQDRQSIGREHSRLMDNLVCPHVTPIDVHSNDRSPTRRLRIGYLSPDFSQRPVGRFMLPLLANHDHRNFEVFCYSDIRRTDHMTERLRACAEVWRDTKAHSDEQLVNLIGNDAIDILIDLSLHTRDNRLLVFARKPAPVQLSYLAYAGSTGLPTIDYRLTDPYLDPPDWPDSCYRERAIRLPNCFWCYEPISERVAVNEPPMSRNGFVTFGCLNNYCKANPLTFSNWCRLLKRIPESRLILFGEPGEHRKRAWEQFEQEELDPRRLSFTGFVPPEQYLRQYQQIDIALDPFPYGGGTTTFDALWMGVPVVSLVGETAVSRAGLSILSNLGLAQFATTSWEKYLDVAAGLATDPARLALLRSGLRPQMRSSPLMDGPRFARDVEAAFRQMWHNFVSSPPCHG